MKLSKDDSDKNDIKYMTEFNLKAINFDHVKTCYANKLGLTEEVAYSVDGIGLFADNFVFIEFKNGKMTGEKAKIKNKIRDSLLILCDILNFREVHTYTEAEFEDYLKNLQRTLIS